MPRQLITWFDNAGDEAGGDVFTLLCPRADPIELKSSRSKGLPLLSTVGHLITRSFRGGNSRLRD
jgi:hypothetical protein